MADKVKLELSQELVNECASLVYRKWAEEFDLLKQVKTEKNDGSKDWQALHEVRLKNHTATFERWDKLKLEMSPYFKLS